MPKTYGENLRAVSDGPANHTCTDVSKANPNGVVFSDTGSNRLNRIDSATDASSSHSERAPRKGRLTQIAKPHITKRGDLSQETRQSRAPDMRNSVFRRRGLKKRS